MATDELDSTDITDITTYLEGCRTEIDEALHKLLTLQAEAPSQVTEAMQYSLFAGGKRLRPILTLASAHTVAPSVSQNRHFLLHPAACAIEMIHTYSLIHDDLPAMDNDTLRRGRPTAHVVFGEGLAILAGDALLTEAFQILAKFPDTSDPSLIDRKLRVVKCIATAAGVTGMLGGQVVDLAAAGQLSPQSSNQGNQSAPSFGPTDLRAMHEQKTGALIKAAAVAGATMIGGCSREIQAVETYATHLGLAFQIVDDILDVESTAESLGKTVGKDAAAGKPTYPSMFGIEESRRMSLSSVEQAKASLATAGLTGPLTGIADWVITRQN
jgi:geranylgeranyl diphosphate synthase type II